MMFVYITEKLSYIDDNEKKTKATQALLKRAMEFVNKSAGLDLTFNYPFQPYKTIKSGNKWIDVDDDVIVNQLNSTAIDLTDLTDDDSDANEYERIRMRDSISFDYYKVISKKIIFKTSMIVGIQIANAARTMMLYSMRISKV